MRPNASCVRELDSLRQRDMTHEKGLGTSGRTQAEHPGCSRVRGVCASFARRGIYITRLNNNNNKQQKNNNTTRTTSTPSTSCRSPKETRS